VRRSEEHRGRVNLRKREEPAPGLGRMDGARLAACHRSRKGEGVTRRKKRKEIEVSVPARIQELGSSCPHVVVAVAEVGRRRLASNKLGKRAPKRAAGSSERGPSSERGSAGETVGSHIERSERRESASPLKDGRGPARRPRVARDRHSAVVASPKAVRESRDRGCKGHRILRRVPVDRRHPGSSRGVGFHEKALTVVLAVSALSDPR